MSGPRQSGKTTFAKMLLKQFQQGIYRNWDIVTHQKQIVTSPYFFQNENRTSDDLFLVVLDELHKYPKWKQYVKGCYDGFNEDYCFFITGSGRLDLFKKGGDSLFGRYFAIRLFPFTLGELAQKEISYEKTAEAIYSGFAHAEFRDIYEQLYQFSGFPEPFIKADTRFYHLWNNERRKTLIKEDIRDAYMIKEIAHVEILASLLSTKIGSPLSINSLKDDIGTSFDSVKRWLSILEQFYYVFFIRAYNRKLSRALKKEQKAYLYNWVEVEEPGIRFENMVALHLYKTIHLWNETGCGKFELFYVRDKDGREVDFLVVEGTLPVFIIECRFNDTEISKNLLYYQKKISVPYAIQLVHQKNVLKKMKHGGMVQYIVSADRFLQEWG